MSIINALLLFHSLVVQARVPIEPDTLSRLASRTLLQVYELRGANEIAARANARLALYGGTSRELLDFITNKIEKLGSVAAYEQWLETKPTISLLDWHRLLSDLDVMLLANDDMVTPSAARIRELQEAVRNINERFPGSILYKKFDINLPHEFFQKYSVGAEQIEAISNMPISERGVESLPWLNVRLNGQNRDLPRWGLEQYSNRQIEYAFVRDLAIQEGKKPDTYGLARQLLRWVRYVSERPDFTVGPSAEQAMQELFELLNSTQRRELIALLQQGQAEINKNSNSDSLGAKLLRDLEKLQLNSGNSVRTEELLRRYGFAAWAREAGVADQRILQALPHRPPGAYVGAQRLGQEMTVVHRTSLHAAQNMSRGALWMSNNQSAIEGRQTVSSRADAAIYTAAREGIVTYGDAPVRITLSADAIIEVDYRTRGDEILILTQEAIARDRQGRLLIQEVDSEYILDVATRFLQDPQTTFDIKSSAARSILVSIDVEAGPARMEAFQAARAHFRDNNAYLYEGFLTNRENFFRALRGESTFWRGVQADLAKFVGEMSANAKAFSVVPPEIILAHGDALFQRYPDLKSRYLQRVRQGLEQNRETRAILLNSRNLAALERELPGLRRGLLDQEITRIRTLHDRAIMEAFSRIRDIPGWNEDPALLRTVHDAVRSAPARTSALQYLGWLAQEFSEAEKRKAYETLLERLQRASELEEYQHILGALFSLNNSLPSDVERYTDLLKLAKDLQGRFANVLNFSSYLVDERVVNKDNLNLVQEVLKKTLSYQQYRELLKLVDSGVLHPSDILSLIRLNFRGTVAFQMFDELLQRYRKAPEAWGQHLAIAIEEICLSRYGWDREIWDGPIALLRTSRVPVQGPLITVLQNILERGRSQVRDDSVAWLLAEAKYTDSAQARESERVIALARRRAYFANDRYPFDAAARSLRQRVPDTNTICSRLYRVLGLRPSTPTN